MTKIQNSKEWAAIGDMAYQANITRTTQRQQNGPEYAPKPELRQMNDMFEYHKNDSADQLYPALIAIRSDVCLVAGMLTELDQKLENQLKGIVNFILTNISSMLGSQDEILKNWAKDMFTELNKRTDQCEQIVNNSQAQIESGFNKLNLRFDSNLAEKIIQNTDAAQIVSPNADIAVVNALNDENGIPILSKKKQTQDSTLKATARPFKPRNQMNRTKKGKNSSNESEIPGSPENANLKNKKSAEKIIPASTSSQEAKPTVKKLIFSIEADPEYPEDSLIKSEYRECQAEESRDPFKLSKSSKRRNQRRKKTDKERAEAEVILHGITKTNYIDGLRYHENEAIKALEFFEEISTATLGETDGFDVDFHHIVDSGRIELWTGLKGQINKPMVVQFTDIPTARSVMKAMKIAGCLKKRTHVDRGKYKKTGDKKKDADIAKVVLEKSDCYGTKSSTKDERIAHRLKQENKKTPEFKSKMAFNERSQNRKVDYEKLSSKFNIVRKDGEVKFEKRPAAVLDPTKAAEIAEAERKAKDAEAKRVSVQAEEQRKIEAAAREATEAEAAAKIEAQKEELRKAEIDKAKSFSAQAEKQRQTEATDREAAEAEAIAKEEAKIMAENTANQIISEFMPLETYEDPDVTFKENNAKVAPETPEVPRIPEVPEENANIIKEKEDTEEENENIVRKSEDITEENEIAVKENVEIVEVNETTANVNENNAKEGENISDKLNFQDPTSKTSPAEETIEEVDEMPDDGRTAPSSGNDTRTAGTHWEETETKTEVDVDSTQIGFENHLRNNPIIKNDDDTFEDNDKTVIMSDTPETETVIDAPMVGDNRSVSLSEEEGKKYPRLSLSPFEESQVNLDDLEDLVDGSDNEEIDDIMCSVCLKRVNNRHELKNHMTLDHAKIKLVNDSRSGSDSDAGSESEKDEANEARENFSENFSESEDDKEKTLTDFSQFTPSKTEEQEMQKSTITARTPQSSQASNVFASQISPSQECA